MLVFLLPSIEKLEHHHEDCDHNIDNNNPEFSENCYVCDFEFSVFSTDSEPIRIPKEQHLDSYYNSYTSFSYSNLSLHSFLLRGPPQSI